VLDLRAAAISPRDAAAATALEYLQAHEKRGAIAISQIQVHA
jgi:hypothetical protein